MGIFYEQSHYCKRSSAARAKLLLDDDCGKFRTLFNFLTAKHVIGFEPVKCFRMSSRVCVMFGKKTNL